MGHIQFGAELLAIPVAYGSARIEAGEKSVAKRTFLRDTVSFTYAGVFITTPESARSPASRWLTRGGAPVSLH